MNLAQSKISRETQLNYSFSLSLCPVQVEAQLSSEDCGRDLAAVQNLLKKHQLLEADITAHEVHTPSPLTI